MSSRKTLTRAFGRVVSHKRRKAGISQEALAFAAEIDRTYLSKIESGIRSPTIEVIFALSQALELADGGLLQRTSQCLASRAKSVASLPASKVNRKIESRRGTFFPPAIHVSASKLTQCVINLQRRSLKYHSAERKHWVPHPENRHCLCWTIDHSLGTPWCEWDDDGSLGVDESCRKRNAGMNHGH
jgi:transcriptional regulator with XRE-family HTH domain